MWTCKNVKDRCHTNQRTIGIGIVLVSLVLVYSLFVIIITAEYLVFTLTTIQRFRLNLYGQHAETVLQPLLSIVSLFEAASRKSVDILSLFKCTFTFGKYSFGRQVQR